MNEPRRPFAFLGLLLRLGVAVGLMGVALHWALPQDGSGAAPLLAAWSSGPFFSALCFGLGWLLLGVSFAVGALRFRILLRGAGLAARWRTLFRAYVVAGFFNLVLPGAILGDVYRFLDARREAGRGAEVAGLVLLERLLSLSALASMGAIALPALPLDRVADGNPETSFVLLAAVVLILTLAPLAPLDARARAWLRDGVRLLARLSTPAADRAHRALDAVAHLAGRPGVVFRAYLLSLATQWLPVGAVFVLALPLDSQVAWYWFALIVPFTTLASLLPISIGGTGVREILFIALFGAVGMRPEVALALALSTLAIAIVWAGVGGVVFAAGTRGAPVLEPHPDSVR